MTRSLELPELDDIHRELCRRSLADFVRQAWPVLEPGNPYIDAWHIHAIAEHLEAITNGELTRLLINIPPGCMKSLMTCVFWPAWEWGPRGMPQERFIGASHEAGLATRDNRRMRLLITSEWFQRLWPLEITSDQNQKTYFENNQTGFRQSCAVSSMTGRRGSRVVWDDPHSVEAAISEAHRETALRVMAETLPTRVMNPETSAIVVIMQRLHENDVAGHILAEQSEYEHLCLPMEYEKDRAKSTSIGFTDPRTEEGELLFPDRFTREVVERDKKAMGSIAYAGQYQQRPAPRKGAMFEWDKVNIVDHVPKITKAVRYWDKAGTADGGAYTAGAKLGQGDDGLFYVMDVERGQWSAGKRESVMGQIAELDGKAVDIWIEQEPGSGGKESAEATIKNLAGFKIRAERPTGDKAARAEPLAVQIEAGNVRILRGDWNQDYLDEMKTFPRGKYKDQIDASTGAFNKLFNGGTYTLANL